MQLLQLGNLATIASKTISLHQFIFLSIFSPSQFSRKLKLLWFVLANAPLQLDALVAFMEEAKRARRQSAANHWRQPFGAQNKGGGNICYSIFIIIIQMQPAEMRQFVFALRLFFATFFLLLPRKGDQTKHLEDAISALVHPGRMVRPFGRPARLPFARKALLPKRERQGPLLDFALPLGQSSNCV